MWLHLSNAQIRVIISFVPYRFCLPAAAHHVCLTFWFLQSWSSGGLQHAFSAVRLLPLALRLVTDLELCVPQYLACSTRLQLLFFSKEPLLGC